jgi:hypothetical protein
MATVDELLKQILYRLGNIEVKVSELQAPAPAEEGKKKKKKSEKKAPTGVNVYFKSEKPTLAAANPELTGLKLWGLAKKNYEALPQADKDKWEAEAASATSVTITEASDAAPEPEVKAAPVAAAPAPAAKAAAAPSVRRRTGGKA